MTYILNLRCMFHIVHATLGANKTCKPLTCLSIWPQVMLQREMQGVLVNDRGTRLLFQHAERADDCQFCDGFNSITPACSLVRGEHSPT